MECRLPTTDNSNDDGGKNDMFHRRGKTANHASNRTIPTIIKNDKMAAMNQKRSKQQLPLRIFSKRKTFKLVQFLILLLWMVAMQAFMPSLPSYSPDASGNGSVGDAQSVGLNGNNVDGRGEQQQQQQAPMLDQQKKASTPMSKSDNADKKDADTNKQYANTGKDEEGSRAVEQQKPEIKQLEKEIKEEQNEESPADADADADAEKEKPLPAQGPAIFGLDHLPPNTTGAFANCTKHSETITPPHPDQHNLTLSCHKLPYRIPPITSSEKIIVGVLSAAGGDGPVRRQSIRDTWAKGHSVFFVVAGPWEVIQEEYDEHHDLIWIDEEEVYDGEKSVLTYKTMAFVKIVHYLSTSANLDIQYAFKTDDDSYVQVDTLHKYLLEREHDEYNYWGWCQRKKLEPLRGENDKWAVSYELYPESRYPRYCQGAGFALSWKFIACAAGPGDHISNARFMPFEDVAMGLLAQRCGVVPTMVEDPKLIHMYRTDRTEERERVNQGLKKISFSKLPIPDMEGRIVQHRIYGAFDMEEHYKSVLDPEGYPEKTTVKWYVHVPVEEVDES